MDSQKKATILYIEDDKGSQRLVKRVLENHGYNIFIAGEGLEGITLARQEKPNLILMDINLPTMDGQEITTRLRSLPHFNNIPIIAVTANTSPGSRQQALAAGCTGFLTKPIDVHEFPEQIESFLSGDRTDLLPHEERNQHLEIYAQRLVQRLEDKIRELEAANQKLRDLDRMKSDFIILVSHELRTPLTLISGYAYLLKERTNREDESHHQSIIDIANGLSMGVERLGQVVNEIISVSRIASGSLDLAFSPTRLAILVNQIMIDIQKSIASRDLAIHVSDLTALPLIEVDGSQLRIAIQNVINNAIKFTPDGGEININIEVVGENVDISVQDNGIGIEPEQQRVIFEQFHVLGSIDNHSTSKFAFQGGGLGLGLAIARGIVEAHDGRIWVESEGYDPDKRLGSTFHILLPIKRS
ncbi:MAG: hybrid sensor histidine kinase/response regulator [Candidatus Promineifilaceae bacterium]